MVKTSNLHKMTRDDTKHNKGIYNQFPKMFKCLFLPFLYYFYYSHRRFHSINFFPKVWMVEEMDDIIVLDENSLSYMDPNLIKHGCFYTTLDCINSFASPNLQYSNKERKKIKRNIKYMSENNKIIVVEKTNVRMQLEEYIQGLYPLLRTYDLKEYEEGLNIPRELKEDVSFFIDCVLCSLANEGKKVIIFTANPGLFEIFDTFTRSLKATKLLMQYSEKESIFFEIINNKLNLFIVSDLETLRRSVVF